MLEILLGNQLCSRMHTCTIMNHFWKQWDLNLFLVANMHTHSKLKKSRSKAAYGELMKCMTLVFCSSESWYKWKSIRWFTNKQLSDKLAVRRIKLKPECRYSISLFVNLWILDIEQEMVHDVAWGKTIQIVWDKFDINWMG